MSLEVRELQYRARKWSKKHPVYPFVSKSFIIFSFCSCSRREFRRRVKGLMTDRIEAGLESLSALLRGY